MQGTTYPTTPKIHTTEAGGEFFLYTLELTDPNTGETKPVTFVVIHRVWKDDPVMAAGMLLFEAAYQGKVPWEAFVAAHYYAMQHPARPRHGSVAHLSKVSVIHALERKAQKGDLPTEDGEPPLPEDPSRTQVSAYLRSEVSRQAKALGDVDEAFIYAELGSEEIRKSVRLLPHFGDSAAELTRTFEERQEEPILIPSVQDDGSVTWAFSQVYSDKLITRAQLAEVDLDDATGSRVLARGLEAVFQSVLDEVKAQRPELWAKISEEGHRLHQLFYWIKPGTGGALLLYPVFDESDGIRFLATDPVKFASAHLHLPEVGELLETAVFTPSKLPEAIREISSAGLVGRYQMQTDSRKKPDTLDKRKKVYSLDEHIDHLVAPTPCHDLTYEDVITYAAETGVVSQQEAEIMIERRVNDVPIAELAKKYGYRDPSGITNVVKRAEAKIRKIVENDATLRAWRDERR